MRHFKYALCALFLIQVLFLGCSKFGTAIVDIHEPEMNNGREMSIDAVITDDGGSKYFIEQGFCYSLFKEPALTDVFSTVVTVNENTDSTNFHADITLPMIDTVYYVRAYVKNSAGLSYSRQLKVSTKPQNNNE